MGVTLRRSGGSRTLVVECPAGALVGDMVYVAGDKTPGGLYLVDLCHIDFPNRRPVGMILQKSTSTLGTVLLDGEATSVYSGLTPGHHLFLGSGSGARLTHSPPGRPLSGKRWLQAAGVALATDALLLRIDQPVVLQAS
jgi:hypothetical protein